MRLINSNRRHLPNEFLRKKVYTYYNFRRKCVSIMYAGKVIGHAQAVLLQNVEFRVWRRAWEHITSGAYLTPHAFVIGTILDWSDDSNQFDVIRPTVVYYSPWEGEPTFSRDDTGETVYKAKGAVAFYQYAYCEAVE